MLTTLTKKQRAVKASQRYYAKNREKVLAYAKEHRLRNLDAVRAKYRAARRTDKAYIKRGLPAPPYPPPAVCDCCGESPGKRALHLDHCHETGVFRGWLCHHCNTGIGLLGDKIGGLLNASLYIAKAMKRSMQ